MTTEPTPADLDIGWRTARQLAEAFIPIRDDHDRTQCENLAIALAAFANAARSSEREAVLRRLGEEDVEPVAQAIYCAATDNDPTDWAFLQVRDSGSAADFYKQARAALTAVRDLLRKGQPT